MFNSLYSRLVEIRQDCEKLLINADDVFNAMKEREVKKLPILENEQAEILRLSGRKKMELEKEVKGFALDKGIKKEEVRLVDILPYFTQKEKEELLDIQRSIIKKEGELTTALLLNQEFIGSVLAATEEVINSAVYINEKESQENHLFLDEEF